MISPDPSLEGGPWRSAAPRLGCQSGTILALFKPKYIREFSELKYYVREDPIRSGTQYLDFEKYVNLHTKLM